MPAVSVRLETRNRPGTTGERMHNQREKDAPEYVHSEFSENNSIIVPMPSVNAMASECLRRRQAGFEPGLAPSGKPKRKPRQMSADAVVSVAGLITFSNDAQPAVENLSWDEQDRRLQEAAENIAKHFNTDVAALSVHRDETAVHAHFALHGFDINGKPISKQMTKGALSQSQDIGSLAFADLGITRGQYLADRIKNGDSPSKTRHRSVHQLHNDLPRELWEAEQRVDKMQKRVTDTEEKLAKRTQELANKDGEAAAKSTKISNLEKRLATYEKRLKDRTAEVARLEKMVAEKTNKIDDLDKQLQAKTQQLRKIGADTDIPKPKTGTITPKPQKTSKLCQPKKPEPRQLLYYPASQVHEFVGGLKIAADKARERQMKLDTSIRRRTRGYQLVREQRPADNATAKLAAVGETLVQRYGLTVTETDRQITVPPQKPATPRQIAAALYRSSRERWPKAHFTVSDEVAEKVIEMAVQDGRHDVVSFDTITHNLMLVKAIKVAEKAPQSTSEKTPETSQRMLEPGPESELPSGPKM